MAKAFRFAVGGAAGALALVGVFALVGTFLRGVPPAKWTALIPYDSANLIGSGDRDNGQGWVYSDTEAGVDVYAVIGKPYRMIFRMVVYLPNRIAFRDIAPGNLIVDPDLNYSRFPPGGSRDMFAFLQEAHPYDDGYLKAEIAFIGPFVPTSAEADWENMAIGETKCVRLWMNLESQARVNDCSECAPLDYHSLEGNTSEAWITREDATTWRADVATDFLAQPVTAPPLDRLSYYDYDFLRERYCECVATKVKNRIVYSKVERCPAVGQTSLHFSIKFIKG